MIRIPYEMFQSCVHSFHYIRILHIMEDGGEEIGYAHVCRLCGAINPGLSELPNINAVRSIQLSENQEKYHV